MESLRNNTTSNYNTAVGRTALYSNTTGSYNTTSGYQALYSNTTGSANTVSGRSALYNNTTGSNNTSLGYNAGSGLTTGAQNTLVGAYCGQSMPSGATYRIAMGYNTAPVGDYYFTFGRDSGSDRVYNQYNANASWTRASDERIKKDITTNTDCGLAFINDLRTVTYKFKAPSELEATMSEYDIDKTEAVHKDKMYGFIAQEVKEAMDTHNITDFAGWHQIDDGEDNMQGISYEMFVMPLVKAVQELSAENKALLTRIEALENA